MRVISRTVGSLLVGATLVLGNGNQDKSLAQESKSIVDKIYHSKLTGTELSKFIKDLNSDSFRERDNATRQFANLIKELVKDHHFDHLENFIRRLQAEANREGVTLEFQRRIERLLSPSIFKTHFEVHIKNLDYHDDRRINYMSALVRLGIFNGEDDRENLLWYINQLSDETLDFLIKTGNESEKITLAFDKRTPTKFLQKLSTDKIDNVRGHVARNWKATPQIILINLSKDKSDEVRYFVVRNPNRPIQILTDLENDPSPYVRLAVAEETPDTSVASRLLAGLAKEKDVFLRLVVANDKNTRPETLIDLIDDLDPEVRANARRNIGLKD